MVRQIFDPAYMPRWWFYTSSVLTVGTLYIVTQWLCECL